MNSLDEAYRNKKDVAALLVLCLDLIARARPGPMTNVLRDRYVAISERRAAEDAGERVV